MDQAALDEALAGPLTAWSVLGGRLLRTVRCANFPSAISFVDRVARAAEAADHHPDIDIRYRSVTLALVTHDSGGLTRRDLELAAVIDGLVPADAE